jgi:diguanylate cyclase (GGDEF)-like protein
MSTRPKQQMPERSHDRSGWLVPARPGVAADGSRDGTAADTSDGPCDVRAPTGDDPSAAAHKGAGDRRDQSTQSRLHAAEDRDQIAHARDLAALTRDRVSDARDLKQARRDAADDDDDRVRVITGSEVIVVAAGKRKRAARHRAQAAEQDAHAAEDRHAAARDREQSALERVHALVDRELLADALALAAIDALTGARARAAGLAELACEVDRCRRTGGTLVVAYIDVVGLKALNDGEGHDAGDELLKRVVTLIRAHLRSYDLVIRVGGDEFVCAMSDLSLLDARERLDDVAAALSAEPQAGAIRTGLAQLAGHETASELVARADRELIDGPHANH